MPGHLIDVGGDDGLLDIGSYGRHGPDRRDRLSPAQIELIARTVRRTPEVMVKVLNRGGQNLGAVARHIDYLTRKGELDIETDDGQQLKGQGTEAVLLDDWDLVLDEERSTVDLKPRAVRNAPKLVQKFVFSMPAGTPPQKVLTAVKNFAREEFGLKHREHEAVIRFQRVPAILYSLNANQEKTIGQTFRRSCKGLAQAR